MVQLLSATFCRHSHSWAMCLLRNWHWNGYLWDKNESKFYWIRFFSCSFDCFYFIAVSRTLFPFTRVSMKVKLMGWEQTTNDRSARELSSRLFRWQFMSFFSQQKQKEKEHPTINEKKKQNHYSHGFSLPPSLSLVLSLFLNKWKTATTE